jgi:hypothetical protein
VGKAWGVRPVMQALEAEGHRAGHRPFAPRGCDHDSPPNARPVAAMDPIDLS